MALAKRKAAWACSPAASKTYFQHHLNAAPSPQQGKAFAMYLYNINAASLDATQAKFRRNPHWWTA